MTGKQLMSLPDGRYNRDDEDDINIEPDNLTRCIVYVLDHFWKRWSHKYLWNSHRQTQSTTTMSISDIVSVQDENHPRGFWKTAKVEELITRRDCCTRAASVRVCLLKGHPTILQLQRPIQ